MLDEFQHRLEERYSALESLRRPESYPVYALEHGLDRDELQLLEMVAYEELRRRGPVDSHWLVWAALAAETGYGYAGDEYWPALAKAPGDWRSAEDRNWLRLWFRKFHTRYRGPAPIGRWADHFGIISWPISGAILPRYLQSHFAKHLFDLRYELAQLARGDEGGLGQVLLDRYDGRSSRFTDFLQQTDLTSRIFLALRDEDCTDQVARIDPSLLRRIVADLGQRREAGDYLRQTRKLLTPGGLRFSHSLQRSSPGSPTGPAITEPVVQGPLLAARRQGDGSFLLGLILADFEAASSRSDLNPDALSKARMRFPGQSWTPAAGLLTLARKDRRLDAFPGSGEPIIELRDLPPEIAGVLLPLCRIADQRCWLLRRQAGGLYKQVVGGRVRSKETYVVLTRDPLPPVTADMAALTKAETKTSGVHAYSLETTERISHTQHEALSDLGISVRVGAIIEPIGLNPRPATEGEPPAWFSTERVVLSLQVDAGVTSFIVQIDGTGPQQFSASNGRLLLAIEGLALGQHRLEFSGIPPAGQAVGASMSAHLDFQIVAPRPWAEAMQSKAGFTVSVDPRGASLEALLAGDASLQVIAPAGRRITWSIETYDAAGHLASSLGGERTEAGGPAKLLASALDRLKVKLSEPIDHAHRVDIVASLDELGRQSLRFPHVVEPLRWTFDPTSRVVRLIDETPQEGSLIVRAYPLETPTEKRDIATTTVLEGLQIAAPGMMLIATYQRRSTPVIVSIPQADRMRSFEALGVQQSINLPSNEADALFRLIGCLSRWRRARPMGHLAIVRKMSTLDRLSIEIEALACGRDFAELLRSPSAGNAVRAQKSVGGSPGFGSRMRSFDWPYAYDQALPAFIDFAATYQIENDQKLCADALALAYNPMLLQSIRRSDAKANLSELLERRKLLRGAFLARASASAARKEIIDARR